MRGKILLNKLQKKKSKKKPNNFLFGLLRSRYHHLLPSFLLIHISEWFENMCVGWSQYLDTRMPFYPYWSTDQRNSIAKGSKCVRISQSIVLPIHKQNILGDGPFLWNFFKAWSIIPWLIVQTLLVWGYGHGENTQKKLWIIQNTMPKELKRFEINAQRSRSGL